MKYGWRLKLLLNMLAQQPRAIISPQDKQLIWIAKSNQILQTVFKLKMIYLYNVRWDSIVHMYHIIVICSGAKTMNDFENQLRLTNQQFDETKVKNTYKLSNIVTTCTTRTWSNRIKRPIARWPD